MFGLTTTPTYSVSVLPASYAGKPAYHYTVTCAETGRHIAAGWGESLEQAQRMVDKLTAKTVSR